MLLASVLFLKHAKLSVPLCTSCSPVRETWVFPDRILLVIQVPAYLFAPHEVSPAHSLRSPFPNTPRHSVFSLFHFLPSAEHELELSCLFAMGAGNLLKWLPKAPTSCYSFPPLEWGAGPRDLLLTKRIWQSDGRSLLRLCPKGMTSVFPFSSDLSLSPPPLPRLLVLLK